MASVPIEFSRPTSAAFARMKVILFQPFDIGKWFVLGFSAWLAGLMDSGGSSSGGGGGGSDDSGSMDEFDQFLEEAKVWVQENLELVIGVGIAVLVLIAAIVLVFLWLSSRGKFMFLDNVVHNRALVKEPWAKFKALGNSLFRWRLGFVAVSGFVVLLFLGGVGMIVFQQMGQGAWTLPPILMLIGLVLVFLLILFVITYIGILLEDFVVPLMYRGSLTTVEAWRKFLVLHRGSFGTFFVYFLWRMLLGLVAAFGVILLGVATCCVGFLVMAIPYVGAVLLLPVSVFFRVLGPEFLRQFGASYDALALPDSGSAIPQVSDGG